MASVFKPQVNYETLAYKILLEKADKDIVSIFQTYARNLKNEEQNEIAENAEKLRRQASQERHEARGKI